MDIVVKFKSSTGPFSKFFACHFTRSIVCCIYGKAVAFTCVTQKLPSLLNIIQDSFKICQVTLQKELA